MPPSARTIRLRPEAGSWKLRRASHEGLRRCRASGMSPSSAIAAPARRSCVSALLFDTGAVNRLGRVDDGTTVTDYDEEEIARKHTLSASLAYVEWNKTKINLIDTPGMANFLSDARAALRVADAALVVVDAVVRRAGLDREGLGRRRRARAAAPRRPEPARSRARQPRAARSSRCAACSAARSIPIQIPIGEEKTFRGVVDLVAMKAVHVRRATRAASRPKTPFPADLAAAAQTARDALIEMVAEADDALMEKFFETGTLSQEELVDRAEARGQRPRGSSRSSARRRLRTSACSRCSTLSSTTSRRPPSARSRQRRRTSDEAASVQASDSAPAGVFVWKTVADPFAGRITLFRVVSGTIKADSTVQNVTRETSERLGHLDAAPGKDADERAGAQGGRSRRGRQAEGHAHERPARRQGRAVQGAADQVPRAGDLVRDRAEDAGRRGEDQHRAAPAAGGGPEHQLQPRPADQAAAARRPGTARTSRSRSRS